MQAFRLNRALGIRTMAGTMSTLKNSVSLCPYFKTHPGQMDAFKSMLPEFVEKTAGEPGCLYYNFTINGDVIFCREGYADADSALAHLTNVAALLKQALEISDLMRLEIHGPGEELEKMKATLEGLNPEWFVLEAGVEK